MHLWRRLHILPLMACGSVAVPWRIRFRNRACILLQGQLQEGSCISTLYALAALTCSDGTVAAAANALSFSDRPCLPKAKMNPNHLSPESSAKPARAQISKRVRPSESGGKHSLAKHGSLIEHLQVHERLARSYSCIYKGEPMKKFLRDPE